MARQMNYGIFTANAIIEKCARENSGDLIEYCHCNLHDLREGYVN
jgi:hypothetical protein